MLLNISFLKHAFISLPDATSCNKTVNSLTTCNMNSTVACFLKRESK